jgi:hypothetical protein
MLRPYKGTSYWDLNERTVNSLETLGGRSLVSDLTGA